MGILPEIKQVRRPPHPFATDWQAVVFRNYGIVAAERIAAVLGTDVGTVTREAARLGLQNMEFDRRWETKGYITVIRQNWYLLDYAALCVLTGMTEAELARTLIEDDFLSEKLGGFKPAVTSPAYAPLSPEQEEHTDRLRAIVLRNRTHGRQYFDFYRCVPAVAASPAEKLRMVYPFGVGYGDILLTGDFSDFSDALLGALKDTGINALWIHAVLYELTGFPFAPEYGAGWEIRLRHLNDLVARLERYGIRLWLYLNEPRGMPLAFFEKHPELKGVQRYGAAAMCTSKPAVRQYLYDSVKKLAQNVPGLGGILTITASENLTNCYSRPETDISECPACAVRPRAEVVAEINAIMSRALADGGSRAELIAWTWGWSETFGFYRPDTEQAIRLLPPSVGVMCVGEEALVIEKRGVRTSILDYSFSNPGPSRRTSELLALAGKLGHKKYVKLQLNNSWECAAVPYLPCFELVVRHMAGLSAVDPDGLMLGWSLGGYPSLNLALAAEYGEEFDMTSWYRSMFGCDADAVRAASETFSAAFEEFPFAVPVLYRGPQNFGPANPLYAQPTGLESTMIGYPFDDIDGWRGAYCPEDLSDAYKTVAAGWERGVGMLAGVTTKNALSVKRVATAALCHFKSAYLQTEWILSRDPAVIEAEYTNTQTLLVLAAEDPSIGFEASNHYFYTENTLLEKLCSLDLLRRQLKATV